MVRDARPAAALLTMRELLFHAWQTKEAEGRGAVAFRTAPLARASYNRFCHSDGMGAASLQQRSPIWQRSSAMKNAVACPVHPTRRVPRVPTATVRSR